MTAQDVAFLVAALWMPGEEDCLQEVAVELDEPRSPPDSGIALLYPAFSNPHFYC